MRFNADGVWGPEKMGCLAEPGLCGMILASSALNMLVEGIEASNRTPQPGNNDSGYRKPGIALVTVLPTNGLIDRGEAFVSGQISTPSGSASSRQGRMSELDGGRSINNPVTLTVTIDRFGPMSMVQ